MINSNFGLPTNGKSKGFMDFSSSCTFKTIHAKPWRCCKIMQSALNHLPQKLSNYRKHSQSTNPPPKLNSYQVYRVRLKNDPSHPTPKMWLLGIEYRLKIFAPNFARLFSRVLSINVLFLSEMTSRIRNWHNLWTRSQHNAKLKVRILLFVVWMWC